MYGRAIGIGDDKLAWVCEGERMGKKAKEKGK